MMTRFVMITLFLSVAATASSQREIKSLLSRQQVTNLVSILHKKIEDTTRFRIQIRLTKYLFEKGGNAKEDMDSAAALIRHAKEINARQMAGTQDGLILLYEASHARRIGNTESGMHLVNRAISQFKSLNDHFRLAEAYLELSRYYDTNNPQQADAAKKLFDTLFQSVPLLIPPGQRDSCVATVVNFYLFQMANDNLLVKLYYLENFARACRTGNDKIHEFWARKEIANIHYQQGQSNTAINELLQIAKEQKEGGYPRICFTYDLLGALYYAGTDYHKALYYSLEAIKNVRTATDSTAIRQFYERVATNYRQTGSIAESVEWNLKMVNYMTAINETSGLYSTLYDLADDMRALGRTKEALKMILDNSRKYPPLVSWEKKNMLLSLAQTYEALRDYTTAEKYCEALIKLHEEQIKRKEITGDVILNQYLASFYLHTGQNDKAEKYFIRTLAEWPKGGQPAGVVYETHFRYKLDSARGDFRSAFEQLRAWHKVRDSIVSAAKAKQIDELKIAYQTEQKDSLINLKEQNIQLLTRQDQLQKSKLQQGAILRNISFAAVALLIIIMALLYNRYRLKQRTNRKLELQQNEIAKQNNFLQHLVNEKEWLLKEIHHRVKNNLQIVMSLLNSQSAYIDNEPALTAIHDSQHRVHAMSLIHQKLYSSENVSTIDMSFYIRELVSYLSDSFDTGQRIRFELNIESLQMDVSQAIPLGLILNEAITNSIKYAFPDDRSGVVCVSLSNTSTSRYLLSISDNGIGMPAGIKKTGSLGMSLMKGLSEDLDGNFSLESDKGTTIKISFVNDQGVKRPNTSFALNN